jgi:hypothetical protein
MESADALNVVKLRYADAPVFLDVASVITQTGITGTLGVSGSWCRILQFVGRGVNALGFYGERPTVTYLPMSGEKFARSLMTPIPPAAILSFLQAGYPVDVVLRLTVMPSMVSIAATAMEHERARPILSFLC